MSDSHTIPCPRCRRATHDGLLCTPCTDSFLSAVGRLAVLLPELATTVRRLDNTTRAVRHFGGPDRTEQVAAAEASAVPARLRSLEGRMTLVAHAAPINITAADLAVAVRFTMVTWLSHLTARYGPADNDGVDWQNRPCGDLRCTDFECAAARAWRDPVCWELFIAWHNVRADDAGAAIVTELLAAARRVEAAVDRREAQVYVGPCDAPDVSVTLEDGTIGLATDRLCGANLFCELGDRTVTCDACGAEYPVKERRAWLLEQVRPVWGRPAQIARWLAAFDVDLTAERLDTWISRDRRRHESRCLSVDPPWAIPACTHLWPVGLESVDADGMPCGRPVFLVGDVLDRLEALRVQYADRAEAQRVEGERLQAEVAEGSVELVSAVSLAEKTVEKIRQERKMRGAV